jgi:hypothetical protein
MSDSEIRDLQRQIQANIKDAFPRLAVAYERKGDLEEAATILKRYFNILIGLDINFKRSSRIDTSLDINECLIVVNNYFRLLLEYYNKKANYPIFIEQIALLVFRTLDIPLVNEMEEAESDDDIRYQLYRLVHIRTFGAAHMGAISSTYYPFIQFNKFVCASGTHQPGYIAIGVEVLNNKDIHPNIGISNLSNDNDLKAYWENQDNESGIYLSHLLERWCHAAKFDRIIIPTNVAVAWLEQYYPAESPSILNISQMFLC